MEIDIKQKQKHNISVQQNKKIEQKDQKLIIKKTANQQINAEEKKKKKKKNKNKKDKQFIEDQKSFTEKQEKKQKILTIPESTDENAKTIQLGKRAKQIEIESTSQNSIDQDTKNSTANNLSNQINKELQKIQKINDSSSLNKGEVLVKQNNIANRMLNVFQNHNKPIQKNNELNCDDKSKNSVFHEYLFKVNVKKEKTLQQIQFQKNENDDSDSKNEKLKQSKLSKMNYISTINAKFNPDILVGTLLQQKIQNFSNITNKQEKQQNLQYFLKGNQYFSGDIKMNSTDQKKISLLQNQKEDKDDQSLNENLSNQEKSNNSDKEDLKQIEQDIDIDDDDIDEKEFENLRKLRGMRYWADDNPTIKCHNCREVGHLQFECPNETKRDTCILCGKDTHVSYECTEKMCFKCNKVGHQAKDCKETNIVQCGKCSHIGHRENRCLKEWTEPTKGRLKLIRCIQCGKNGHIKCFQEKDSLKIKISTKVLDDLNEFVHNEFLQAEKDDISSQNSLQNDVDAFDYVNQQSKQKVKGKKKKLTKTQKKQRQLFINDCSNILMPSSSSSSLYEQDSDEENSYDQEYYSEDSDLQDVGNVKQKIQQKYGKDKLNIFCAICAGRHSEDQCPNGHLNKQNQLNSVRDRFAQATQFKQVGEYYNRKDDFNRDDDNHTDSYYYEDYNQKQNNKYKQNYNQRQNYRDDRYYQGSQRFKREDLYGYKNQYQTQNKFEQSKKRNYSQPTQYSIKKSYNNNYYQKDNQKYGNQHRYYY